MLPPQGGRKHPHQEFIQVDTSNVLFICGGAFVGLDKMVESRVGKTGMGFGAEIKSRDDRRVGDLLAMVQPEDMLKYGLIPEFVGRLPIVATLHDLDEGALVRILREPKNAIIKQYQKYFDLEKVRLKFTDDAVAAVAREAMKRERERGATRGAGGGHARGDVRAAVHPGTQGVHHHARGHRQQGAPHPHLGAQRAVRLTLPLPSGERAGEGRRFLLVTPDIPRRSIITH